MSDMNNGDGSPADVDDDKQGEEKRFSGTRYPYFNMEEALGFARAVRDCGGNEVREDDLLQHLKLSRSTKSWIYKLSAAREFGLIVKQGRKAETRIALTELAKKLLLPGDEAETQAARLSAFFTPALYQKLYQRYAGAGVPQVAGLANILHRDYELLESVAQQAATAFIESARYAGLVTPDGHISARPPATNANKEAPTPAPSMGNEPKAELPVPSGNGAVQPPTPAGFEVYGFQLRKNLRVDLALPHDLTQTDVRRLHRWLQTLPVEEPQEDGA